MGQTLTSAMTDAEIGKYWNELETDKRIRLLAKVGFPRPKYAAALDYNWAGLIRPTRIRLRKGILGDHRWNHHIGVSSPAVGGGVQTQPVEEVPALSPPVRQRQQRQVSGAARPRKTREIIGRRAGYCRRCGLRFGSDGVDTLEFSVTGQCERCFWEQMTGKMANDRRDEEVGARQSVTDYYIDPQKSNPRLGLKRRTKWE